MGKILSIKEFSRMSDEYAKVKYQCKNCGHKEVIPYWVKKQLCSYCGNYVFKNDKDEFEYRLQEKMRSKK